MATYNGGDVNTPDEPKVSYALVGQAAGWSVEITEDNLGQRWVILHSEPHRINIDHAGNATVYRDGGLVGPVENPRELLGFIHSFGKGNDVGNIITPATWVR